MGSGEKIRDLGLISWEILGDQEKRSGERGFRGFVKF